MREYICQHALLSVLKLFIFPGAYGKLCILASPNIINELTLINGVAFYYLDFSANLDFGLSRVK